jgi:Carboxypeptidase regulatory-like domain
MKIGGREEGAMGGIGVRFGGWRAVAVLLGLLATAGPAAAQAGRVVGRVTDAAGRPVRGASVVLVAADSAGAPARREVTGETGGFDFSAVQPGVYTLRASGAGYRERTMRVELAPAELESVIARLPQARPANVLADEPRRRPR